MAKTLYDKIYETHLVNPDDPESPLIYIDGHLIFEVPTAQAFDGLRNTGRRVRRPDLTLATVDHNVPTDDRSHYIDATSFIKQEESRTQVLLLEKNVKAQGIKYFGMSDKRQGIVHVVGPEQGFTLPGSVIFCGDSHTPTHGAVGALAISGSVSDIEHVLATQTVLQKKYKNYRVRVEGDLPHGVYSKDIILTLLGRIGTAGATGCVIEFCGSTIRGLSMEARLVICNMSIEAGARSGLVAPDEVTFNYLKGRPLIPSGEDWDKALSYWNTMYSDEDAIWDFTIDIDASEIVPSVTWGTSPDDVVPITGTTPDPQTFEVSNPLKAAAIRRSLEYMGLTANMPVTEIKVDRVFIGSCTNSRIEDLRVAARVAKGRKVDSSVYAMVVPGSGLVRDQAEREGLDIILKEAGFDWREAGCSMCLAMNTDVLSPGERCASTTNRNYEGRQGAGGRTHLVSPGMAAAAAITGYLTDVRQFISDEPIGVTQIKAEPEPEIQPQLQSELPSCPQPEIEFAPVQNGSSGIPSFNVVRSFAAPFEMVNINTDLLIPGPFLKTVKRTGLGPALFRDLRYDKVTGKENPNFVLNLEPYRESKILVCTGANFGCGSSREHAVWGLVGFGFRCIIAPSFASILFNNCGKNGILAIPIPDAKVLAKIYEEAAAKRQLQVDLPNQVICSESGVELARFDVDPYTKYCLVNGLDDISNTLKSEDKITAFEKKQVIDSPWLFGRIQKLRPAKELGLLLAGARDAMDW